MSKDLTLFKTAFESYLERLVKNKRFSENELSKFLNQDYQSINKAESTLREFHKFLIDNNDEKNDFDEVGLEAINHILHSYKIQDDADKIGLDLNF